MSELGKLQIFQNVTKEMLGLSKHILETLTNFSEDKGGKD